MLHAAAAAAAAAVACRHPLKDPLVVLVVLVVLVCGCHRCFPKWTTPCVADTAELVLRPLSCEGETQ